jgi:hypothetical protein
LAWRNKNRVLTPTHAACPARQPPAESLEGTAFPNTGLSSLRAGCPAGDVAEEPLPPLLVEATTHDRAGVLDHRVGAEVPPIGVSVASTINSSVVSPMNVADAPSNAGVATASNESDVTSAE